MTLYAISDVQGCAQAVDKLFKEISFDRHKDRLWFVGDLVNRGPKSLRVLRTVMALGDRATCVLGNHDLRLLATAAGIRESSGADTFQDVLEARDCEKLLDWLRRRPLLHRDKRLKLALVHAGIPPVWKIKEAARHATEVEGLLAGPKWKEALRGMYQDAPDEFHPGLKPKDRHRFTINGLTRMRYCDAQGRLDFKYTGPPGSQPKHLTPWFDLPRRGNRKWHIVFGHWSALGVMQRRRLTALDSGSKLTAVPLDPPGRPIAVSSE